MVDVGGSVLCSLGWDFGFEGGLCWLRVVFGGWFWGWFWGDFGVVLGFGCGGLRWFCGTVLW